MDEEEDVCEVDEVVMEVAVVVVIVFSGSRYSSSSKEVEMEVWRSKLDLLCFTALVIAKN